MGGTIVRPLEASPPVKKKIFLSHGRDKYTRDALRIKASLEARGHDVWFDAEQLREGREWEAWIEQGLQQCDLLVLLMTPYSVRRRDRRDPSSRDGYCLNEIAAALLRNRLIIPVLLVSLEPCGPPTSICRIQYLDMRDAVPIADREPIFQVRFDRLVRAIEGEDLDFEGGQARLIRLLKPLPFEKEIGKHIARFHGRSWVFEEIDKWLYAQSVSRVFWLTGKAGAGKTAISAHLCHARREVLAYHLCNAHDDDKRNPARAVLSIAYQMSQHLPKYERALENLDLEAESEKNAQTLFDRLVVGPLQAGSMEPDGPRIVIIDAMDEASRDGRNEIARLIAESWENTPAWLRLIVTSRPDEAEVEAALSRLRPYVLDTQSENNKKDLREYLASGMAELSIPVDDQIINQILDRSEGLFLYAEMVLEALDHKDLSIDRIEDFPVGLGGHYQRFFERQFPNLEEYHRLIRPMLEPICAQREALPVLALKIALGSPADLVQRVGKLGSLFPRTPQRAALGAQSITPFHKSIRDWLTEEPTLYAIDLASGESLLANAALRWEELPPGSAQRYLVRHGVQHMVNAREFVQACEMIHGLLLQLPRLPDGIALEQLHDAGLYLCAGLAQCPPGQARALPAADLVDVATECGGIDHYAMMPLFRILYTYHQAEWPQVRKNTVGSSSWSAMYAASLVMAEAYGERPGQVLTEISELTASKDMREQELGLYAFKLLEGDSGRLMDSAKKFANERGFIVRALLNEFLLTHVLIGADACGFIQEMGLWDTPWPYHRTQLDDIAATQELVRKSLTPFSAEPGVARARDELATTFRARDEILASTAIEAEPVLQSLLRDYERLPWKLKDIPAAAQAIRRSAHLDQLLLLLFAHPAWEVRAGASTIAATLTLGRPDVAKLIAGWIEHPDYRVRYAAIEAAYRIRHQDHASMFGQAVHRHASDEQAWVRGIVADCLADWIICGGKRDHAERLEPFKLDVVHLLHDSDMWPLESMVYLIRQIGAEGVDVMPSLGPIGGLLGRVPGWETLDRPKLQPALDALFQLADKG